MSTTENIKPVVAPGRVDPSMRYFGSKATLTETIYKAINSRMASGSFCDPFGGIGTVGSYMRQKGYEVWSGDMLTFPHLFQVARIKYPHNATFAPVLEYLSLPNVNELFQYLNTLAPSAGWFVEEYSQKRLFFTQENAMKIEACRSEIDSWDSLGLLNYDEKAILLSGLINSMDKVANTAGTYYAYLKSWNRKSLNPFSYEAIPIQQSGSVGLCYHEPADKLVARRKFDVVYLDPPYNERSYSHYYHLPETIANGACPDVYGKSGIPCTGHGLSEFNRKTKACDALDRLISLARFRLLFFHYADNGLIPPKKVVEILSSYGNIEKYSINAKGYYTGSGAKISSHDVYLVTNE